jgi:hypothetical protein
VTDRRNSLAHGVLVQGSIKGRVLGMRILTLDTTVILAPADVSTASPPAIDLPASAPRSLSAPGGIAGRRLGRPVKDYGVAGSNLPRPVEDHPVAGPGLAQAVKDIRESAGLLAQARRIAP